MLQLRLPVRLELELIAYQGELEAATCQVLRVEPRVQKLKVLELALKIRGQSPMIVPAAAEEVVEVALEVTEASSRDLLLAQAS